MVRGMPADATRLRALFILILAFIGLCFSVPKGVVPPPSLKNVGQSLTIPEQAHSNPHFYRFMPRSRLNTPSSKHPSTGMAYTLHIWAPTQPYHCPVAPLHRNYRNLSTWASNGVLLLNTCLTVRAHEAGSHSNKGWEQFTDRVVDVIDRYGGANLALRSGGSAVQKAGTGRGVVFLAWGSWAQKRVARLDKARVSE
jgi:uracil-DNA glycosylase